MNILQQIWTDWLNNEGHCEVNPSVDPNKYYYPFYGMGYSNSDLMLVGSCPAYNLENMEKRSSVKGPEEVSWTSDFNKVQKRWLRERFNSDQNRLQFVIREIAKRLSVTPADLYFTNYNKDGLVGDKEIDKKSEECWLKYFPEEINFIDPNLIICFGKKPSVNTLELYNTNFNSITSNHGRTYNFEEVDIMTCLHWGYVDRNGGKINGESYEENISNLIYDKIS